MSDEKKYITEGDGVLKVRTCAWSPPGDHPVGCGMFLHVKDGKVVKVEGDPDHPVTQGRLCPRCIALDEVMYHEERLTYPMKRAKENRGKDIWERITWEEAYSIIEERVRDIWDRDQNERIFTMTGTGRESTLYAPAYGLAVLNTPNGGSTSALSGQSCYGPRASIANFLLGAGYPELDYAAYFPERYDDPRYRVPEYMLVWGKDPLYSNPDGLFGHAVIDLMKRGSKLIVIDPRTTWLAAHAEHHLQLRPGTDAAVGLGLINVIISEELYDKEFVEKWCYGFEELAERAAEYPPERVEEISWVPAEKLIAAARAMSAEVTTSGLWGLAIDQMCNGIQAGQTFLAIMAITGNLDVPGGVTLAKPTSFMGRWRYEISKYVSDELNARQVVPPAGQFGMYRAMGAQSGVHPDTLLDYLELENPPYPLEMCWIVGSNPLACTAAQPERWYEALKKVDFVVVQDIFKTPTIMGVADVVLPLSTFAEHNGIVLPHFGRNTHFVGAMNRAVDPGETKSDLEILMDMGKRLQPELWPWEGVEDFLTQQLQTVYDWTFEDLQDEVIHQQEFSYRKYETGGLRNDGQPGFDTPTGKVELKSSIFKMFGIDPLPYYEEPTFSPVSQPAEVVAEYPLSYTTGGRNIVMFHSEHRQIKSLRAFQPTATVQVNPKTASAYGITEGSFVAIETLHGRCVQQAHLTPSVPERLIHLEHAWWFPEEDGEAPNLYGVFKANANQIMPHANVGITGFGAPYKNGICKIYKVDSLDA